MLSDLIHLIRIEIIVIIRERTLMPFGHACAQTGMQVSDIYAALRTLITEVADIYAIMRYIYPWQILQTKSHCVQWS